ncbi:hypothetical protein [Paenibacillus sp. MSJ-34]|uniref:hypothetical protein n=1 Tax=Paenibacillus sp. MSJ-34 TaxID=2841529 RepID=UPI001C10FE49|nr:hypothetical protein [Paenibacillus sp. MSJ-34]MBU5440991.1 hypothetical protein [Paenibacillus sp. MSJ-34]
MNIIVNDALIANKIASIPDFADFWQQFLSDCLQNKDIIQEVSVNGQIIKDPLVTYMERNFSEVKEMRVVTVTQREAMKESLQELQNYLPKLIKATDSIAELYYEEVTEQTWDLFTQLVEGMNWVYQAIDLCVKDMEQLDERLSLCNQLKQILRDLSIQFPAINDALETQDYISVGDVLKYELKPLFEHLNDIIS